MKMLIKQGKFVKKEKKKVLNYDIIINNLIFYIFMIYDGII